MNDTAQIQKWITKVNKSAHEKSANALVKYYYREILGYIFNRTHDKELAMDITQEIFVSMLQSLHSYDAKKSAFRTWLYQIASRRLADYYRSSTYTKKQTELEMDESFDAVAPTDDLTDGLLLQEIETFIDGLDKQKGLIFKLKTFDDLTFANIAQRLNLSESTVKTQFYATQKLVREEFK